MGGYIKLHRSVRQHWIWRMPIQAVRWLDLIMMAAWEDYVVELGNGSIYVKRGQIATTTRVLQGIWQTNAKTVLALLEKLERNGMVELEKNTRMTLITIVNYDKFQNADDQEDYTPTPTWLETGDWERDGKHNKEYKNIKKTNNNNTNNEHGEEKYFNQLENSQIFTEATKKNLKVTDAELHERHGEFFREITAKEKTHANFNDYKRHFYDWLKIKKQDDRRNKQTWGYAQGKGGNAAEDRNRARRGNDVSAKTADDFEGAF